MAVVGGGFHSKGLHNILEAATFGLPIVFGNHYRKNPEADLLIEKGAAVSFESSILTSQFLKDLLKNPVKLKAMGESAARTVQEQPNSTQIIITRILKDEARVS